MQPHIIHFPSQKPWPFSDAVKAGGFVFLSGQVSMDDQGRPVYGSVQQQTGIIMRNIQQVLATTGCSLNDIVKVKVWLSDMRHFEAFNEAYRPWFGDAFPARTLTTSAIAFGLDVEIEIVALACNKEITP